MNIEEGAVNMITNLNLRHKSNYVLNITEYPFVLRSGYWIATYASDKKNIETTLLPRASEISLYLCYQEGFQSRWYGTCICVE